MTTAPRTTHDDAHGMPSPADAGYDARRPFEARLAEAAKRGTKRRGQVLLRLAIGAIGWLARDRAPVLPPPVAGDPSVRRILLVRVDLLGDTVLSTPAIRTLRRAYPNARIDVLVQPAMVGVLAGDPDIAEIIGYNPHAWREPAQWPKLRTWLDVRRFLRRVRSPRYDIAISVSGDIGSIVTRLTGARWRFGYAGEAYAAMLTHPVPGARYRTYQHEVRYVLDLARAAGGLVAEEDARPYLIPTSAAVATARATLTAARRRLGAHGPVVAIHAGARNGQAKRWPLEHFAALIDHLVDDLGALVVLTGSPNEAALSDGILSATTRPVLNLTGKTSLAELVALLSASDVLVTGDSGPMHIACAVGTPVVAIHGPTDPALSGPTAPDALIVRQRLWCSPCYDASATAECRFGNPVCMKSLAPSLVFAAVRKQLARRAPLVAAGPANDVLPRRASAAPNV